MVTEAEGGEMAEMEVQVPLQNSVGKIVVEMVEVMGWGDSDAI